MSDNDKGRPAGGPEEQLQLDGSIQAQQRQRKPRSSGPSGPDLAGFLDRLPPDLQPEFLEILPDLVQAKTQAQLQRQDERFERLRQWEAPTPLGVSDVPPFPYWTLPDCLRDYVLAVAESYQVPVDVPGAIGLGLLAGAAARKMVVEPRPGWQEPTNLYMPIAMGPGNRKSSVFREMARPIRAYEKEEAERLRPAIIIRRAARKRLRTRLDEIEEALASLDNGGGDQAASREAMVAEAARIAAELEKPEPGHHKLIADEATAEALVKLMADQGGRLLCMSAETDLFSIICGRYSRGEASLSPLLAAHAGDDIAVDRIGRAPIRMERPALTLVVMVQPELLAGLLRRPELRGRGLLARFFYVLPVSMVGSRKTNPPPVPDNLRQEYERLMRAVWTREPRADGQAEVIRLSAPALAALHEFMTEREPRLGPDGDLATVADWAGKAEGLACRLAAALHLACSADPVLVPVAKSTMTAALQLVKYALAHAQAALGLMGGDPATAAGEYVLGRLRQHGLERVSKREVYRLTRTQAGYIRKVKDLDEPLALLVEHGFLRQAPSEDGEASGRPAGRPRSPMFEVTPWLWVPGSAITATTANTSGSGSCGGSGRRTEDLASGCTDREADWHDKP